MDLLLIVIGFIIVSLLIHKAYHYFQKKIDAPRKELLKEVFKLRKQNSEIEATNKNLKSEIEFLQRGFIEKDNLFEVLKTNDDNSFSKIASLYSDFQLLQFEISSNFLRTKKHPAFTEAERIDDLQQVSKGYLDQLNKMKYKYELIEKIFPELSTYLSNIDSLRSIKGVYSLKALHEIGELKKFNTNLLKKIEELEQIVQILKEGIRVKDDLFESMKSRTDQAISRITSLYADFILLQYDISSQYLETKKQPAVIEAKRISELKNESKAYLEQYSKMKYKYEMLLQLFPELTQYVDDFDSIKQLDDIKDINSLVDDYDRTQFYLSNEEFSKLSVDARNQLALERYISGQKSKWYIGRDYELYSGQQYEKEGWDVEYIGMEKKLYDLGRDLIAIKGNEHLIIQCKYWSREKVIHEKHITQLFGTAIEYSLNLPDSTIVTPVFITNINLSETAMKFANRLGVVIKDNFLLKEFPRIKCNVNYDENGNESLIYHLPFDQQYDRTKINKKKEFYAFTVNEAVGAGFRRAYRYFGA